MSEIQRLKATKAILVGGVDVIEPGKDIISSDAINLTKSKNVNHILILEGTEVISWNVENPLADALTKP
jgi:hypothetical protein